MAPPDSIPWLYIPSTAQPGQPHAFADRQEQTVQLYRSLVDAGNQVRLGRGGIRKKILVHGYMGTGKSALILQALKLLREPGQAETAPGSNGEALLANGQRIQWSSEMPAPIDIQRWLVLRFSGKQMAGISALPDDLQRRVAEEEARSDSTDSGVPLRAGLGSVLMSVAGEVKTQTEKQKKQTLDLPLVDRVLRTDDVRLYEGVRTSLKQLTEVIDFVKRWEGAQKTDSQKITTKLESVRDAEAHLSAQVGKKFEELSPETQAALKVAANIIYKNNYINEATTQVEKSWRVGAQVVVDMLNSFFEATDAANLPTILVLDDFDEFASAEGPSHEARARLLSWIIGPITGLRPTCLIIALRSEYFMEDVVRQYESIIVPPMDRESALLSIDAWSDVQEPSLSKPDVQRLRKIGELLLEPFPADAPVVVPFRFLQLLVWIANNASISKQTKSFELLQRYMRMTFSYGVYQTVMKTIARLSDDDLVRSASAESLPAELFTLTVRERRDLQKAGLLRPAMAGDESNTDLVLDPLCAYLRAAQLQQESASKTKQAPPASPST